MLQQCYYAWPDTGFSLLQPVQQVANGAPGSWTPLELHPGIRGTRDSIPLVYGGTLYVLLLFYHRRVPCFSPARSRQCTVCNDLYSVAIGYSMYIVLNTGEEWRTLVNQHPNLNYTSKTLCLCHGSVQVLNAVSTDNAVTPSIYATSHYMPFCTPWKQFNHDTLFYVQFEIDKQSMDECTHHSHVPLC